MSALKDITGQRFGRLVAIAPTDGRRDGKVVWLCKCDCENEIMVSGSDLRSGNTKSCGCLQRENARTLGKRKYIGCGCGQKMKDMSGQRFGRLLVIEPTKKKAGNGNIVWKCKCDCGNIHEVTRGNLIHGSVTSCGCLAKELSSARLKGMTGAKALNWQGGEWTRSLVEYKLARQSPEYKEWRMFVFKRDMFKCRRCNSTKRIRAHHILSFTVYKKDRYNVDNGITLCEDCHMTFHNIYGYHGFDYNMLSNFLVDKTD